MLFKNSSKLRIHSLPYTFSTTPQIQRQLCSPNLFLTHIGLSTRLLSTKTQQSRPITTKLRNFLLGTTGILFTTLFIDYYFDSRAAVHKYVITPLLRATIDVEQAHKLAIWTAKWGLTPRDRLPDDERLAVEVWGKKISNPVGLAAGFDKNGEAIDSMFDLGFGIVEIGSITPEPQPGNPKPRVFHLKSDRALVNRYGFNSDGHRQVALRLRERLRRYFHRSAKLYPNETAALLAASTDGFASLSDVLGTNRSLRHDRILGINLGKNKSSSPNSHEDYVTGVKTLGNFADFLVINVSSPNTPGLRSLQRRGVLEDLLRKVMNARDTLQKPRPPLLVKIAPDLSDEDLRDIAYAALKSRVDGIIVSNTTISRPDTLESDPELIAETGGLSGPPLKPLALHALREIYKHTQGRLILVGCGGINDARDALEYARAGATFVQVYTSFGYDGVGKPRELKDGILRELKGKRWIDVIGEDWQRKREI
ncbi:hypothetical protein G9A89_002896 [Geosiphon pyriformis]|nr:hypothetical protein G9A89_002896 [Geosiphon pyriformis]